MPSTFVLYTREIPYYQTIVFTFLDYMYEYVTLKTL